jgi:hypothetical protein
MGRRVSPRPFSPHSPRVRHARHVPHTRAHDPGRKARGFVDTPPFGLENAGMMYRRLAAVLAAVMLVSCSAPGAIGTAEAAKPAGLAGALPPDPDTRTIIHEDGDGRRSPLLDPRGLAIYNDYGHGLEPTITIERADELGYDIVLDFHNETLRPAELGSITVGVITLGPDFGWLNLNRRSSIQSTTRRDFSGQNRPYPGGLYSPVGVLHNDRFAVGVSLLYDLLQDRHGVNVKIHTPGGRYAAGPGGAGYSIGFELGNRADGPARVTHPAMLAPGEERRYRVAVRATKLSRPVTATGPQEWLAVLEPYRRHFESLYGGVTYSRDDRPVRARSIASPSGISPASPMGFNGGQRRRVDLVGWGPMVTDLLRPSGFERTMLWNPGGLYFNNRDLNYPSRFLSQLTTTPRMNTAFDSQIGLPRLARTGHQVGLWWGRASRVSRQWDSPQWEPLDLDEPDRVTLALNEMRLADRAGATFVGLDAFNPREMPVWQQYEWLIELRRRYPHVTFLVEPMACDVLHSLGATFLIGWLDNDRTGRPETRFRVRHPHYLADYLLPGHETWSLFRYHTSQIAESAARVQLDAEYLASTGHVPVLSTRLALTDASRARAAASWLQTVPDTLKTDAHRTATPPVLRIPGADDLPEDPADDSGDGGDRGGASRDGGGDEQMETRPFMLPNGRVIRLPVRRSGR